MRKSLKIATVATVLLLAIGTFALVYAYSPNNSGAATNRLAYYQQIKQLGDRHPGLRLEAFHWFIAHANATEVSGTVVSQVRGMLVLSTDAGQVRVLLPRMWSFNNQILNRTELFNSTFAGQNITLKVLKGEWQKDNFSLNIMIGYEAIKAEAHAYAVLPFNIVPNS